MFYIILSLMILILLTWIFRFLRTFRFFSNELYLDENSIKNSILSSQSTPLVSIIIPARNEEDNITDCINTLINQDYKNIEIIIIDDQSTDGTPRIIQNLSEKHEFLRTITIKDLPDGWTGKTNAMHRGTKEAKGEWILFTDADTRHSPKSLSTTLSYAVEQKIDMLSLLPKIEAASFWEKTLQPVAAGILLLQFPQKRVNSKKYSAAFANGQFVLIKKDIYDQVGGHEAVKDKLLEDVALAKAVKEAGFNLVYGYGQNLFMTRMYINFKNTYLGWRRIFSQVSEYNLGKILFETVSIAIVSGTPFIALVLSGVNILHAPQNMQGISILYISILQCLFLSLSVFRVFRLSESETKYAFLYPISSILILILFCDCIIHTILKKKIAWRDRSYKIEI